MTDLQLFEDNLDRWGGDLARWPLDARRDAATLLAGSALARALHAAMLEVERVLAPPLANEDAGFTDFAAVATRRPQEKARRVSPTVRRAGWGAAAAAALVLGMVVGDSNLGGHDDSPDQVLASALGPSVGSVDVD